MGSLSPEEGLRPTVANSFTPPTPEVKPKQKRRRLSSEYKLQILAELDRCTDYGEQGAILRREGLYTSSITEWRRARDAGALGALDKIRGRKPKYDSRDNQIKKLENELEQAKAKLAQAEAIIDVQKKVSEIFGIVSPMSEKNEKSS
tara:strand:- start:1066 stop:1506 length:441 start_codon:yes stop_codon:yes gene_type:complete